MSSIFELAERLRRLRQMFSYFRTAAVLTGAEVREAVQANGEAKAREEWLSLLSDIRDCLSEAQALSSGDGQSAPSASSRLSEGESRALIQLSRASTLH